MKRYLIFATTFVSPIGTADVLIGQANAESYRDMIIDNHRRTYKRIKYLDTTNAVWVDVPEKELA